MNIFEDIFFPYLNVILLNIFPLILTIAFFRYLNKKNKIKVMRISGLKKVFYFFGVYATSLYITVLLYSFIGPDGSNLVLGGSILSFTTLFVKNIFVVSLIHPTTLAIVIILAIYFILKKTKKYD